VLEEDEPKYTAKSKDRFRMALLQGKKSRPATQVPEPEVKRQKLSLVDYASSEGDVSEN